MRKAIYLALTAGILCLALSACGGNDIPPPEDVDGNPITEPSASSMFNGTPESEQTPGGTVAPPTEDTVDLNGGNTVENTSTPGAPGPGMFDDIPDPTAQSPEETPSVVSTPREQMIVLTDEWGLAIPTINIELFKLEEGSLLEQISEQFPLSLRYVWGQPKTRMEVTDGGYRDIWEIGSEDGSFKGRILVLYDGKDEVRATVRSADAEVLVDEKNLTGKVTPAEETGASALEILWDRMNSPDASVEAINADLADLTYEEAIIQWGRSDHKAEDGAYCWRVGDDFICILFTEDGSYSSYRIESGLFQ